MFVLRSLVCEQIIVLQIGTLDELKVHTSCMFKLLYVITNVSRSTSDCLETIALAISSPNAS